MVGEDGFEDLGWVGRAEGGVGEGVEGGFAEGVLGLCGMGGLGKQKREGEGGLAQRSSFCLTLVSRWGGSR